MASELEATIAAVDEAGTRLVEIMRDQGLVCVVIHQTEGNDVRLICPQSLEVVPLLKMAMGHLDAKEMEHRC